MAKRKPTKKDTEKKPRLRTLTEPELAAATGGYGVPGQIKSSTGGGGLN